MVVRVLRFLRTEECMCIPEGFERLLGMPWDTQVRDGDRAATAPVQVLARNAPAASGRTRFQKRCLEAVQAGLACRWLLRVGQEEPRQSNVNT